MKLRVLTTAMALAGFCAGMTLAQEPPKSAFYKGVEAFEKGWPTIGDRLPELTLYHPDGREVNTLSLKGHYTVLTLGCLT